MLDELAEARLIDYEQANPGVRLALLTAPIEDDKAELWVNTDPEEIPISGFETLQCAP